MNETCRSQRGEGYEACDDVVVSKCALIGKKEGRPGLDTLQQGGQTGKPRARCLHPLPDRIQHLLKEGVFLLSGLQIRIDGKAFLPGEIIVDRRHDSAAVRFVFLSVQGLQVFPCLPVSRPVQVQPDIIARIPPSS